MMKVIASVPSSFIRPLEFGCGLGGNLIAIASEIERGFGIDINRGYLRHARRLARSASASNLEFRWYDGGSFPQLDGIDFAFSLGVFERISKKDVEFYIRQIRDAVVPHAWVSLYFLSGDAIQSGFTRRLGEESYVYWNPEELKSMFDRAGFCLVSISDWKGLDGCSTVAYLCTAKVANISVS
jgi:cyclopropane fatty-acyl-phospholipid synthase-like methyltransferase